MPRRLSPIIVALCLVFASTTTTAAAEPPVILQGDAAVVARLLDPYRELIQQQAEAPLIVLPSAPLKGLVAVIEGRADVALVMGSCVAIFIALFSSRPEFAETDLRVFEVDRLDGHVSNFVTRGAPDIRLERLIAAARSVAAAHPF